MSWNTVVSAGCRDFPIPPHDELGHRRRNLRKLNTRKKQVDTEVVSDDVDPGIPLEDPELSPELAAAVAQIDQEFEGKWPS